MRRAARNVALPILASLFLVGLTSARASAQDVHLLVVTGVGGEWAFRRARGLA